MPELPPPPGRIPGNGGIREAPSLLFSDFAPKEHALERVPEVEEEEEEKEKEVVEIYHVKSASSDNFMEYEEERARRRRCPPCFRMCCACTCLIVSLFLLILLIVGVSLVSSVKSSLPLVNVANLRFPKMEFNGTSAELVLNADSIAVLQFSNKNDKTVLYYSAMTADVSSESIDLGHTKIQGFRQDPDDVRTVRISTRVRKSSVYDVDATLLRDKLKRFEAVVDVFLSGKMGLDFWGVRINLPTVIACEDVNQNEVIQGLKPKCHVLIFEKR
ncbi:PREDICTED: uncharacterized protein LOC104800796 [Tarenaya hassleriana]|uniref:uncharacterized protein LOC104800796 n=1 Tax=Tarenaya hassleriana TaxID=28532 RepID=UPI00053C45FD|nr:PREDICTED: uncharacterized protein LOC104800796 [Tarenaya hassleriana]